MDRVFQKHSEMIPRRIVLVAINKYLPTVIISERAERIASRYGTMQEGRRREEEGVFLTKLSLGARTFIKLDPLLGAKFRVSTSRAFVTTIPNCCSADLSKILAKIKRVENAANLCGELPIPRTHTSCTFARL